MYLTIECMRNEQHVRSFDSLEELVKWLKRFDFKRLSLVIVTPNRYYYFKEQVIERYEQGLTV